jgi:CDP-diacylglycerol--serine O-phosphatidyltransferase
MTPDPIEDDEPSIVVRPRRKGIYALPNAITLCALFSAFYAIVMAMNGRFEAACVAIFAAAILDSLDGRVARMTNTQSAFGEQMDSLSDMVAFGAAPALIVYMWALKDMGKPGWIPAFVYIAGAALRLARFNVNIGVVDKRFFQGLPSPAAAALVMGGLWHHVVCRAFDGDECALLQLQSLRPPAQRALHRAGRHHAWHRPCGPGSGTRSLRCLLCLRAVGLCHLRVAQVQGQAGQRHLGQHRRAR